MPKGSGHGAKQFETEETRQEEKDGDDDLFFGLAWPGHESRDSIAHCGHVDVCGGVLRLHRDAPKK